MTEQYDNILEIFLFRFMSENNYSHKYVLPNITTQLENKFNNFWK
jgi:hypothetical protein